MGVFDHLALRGLGQSPKYGNGFRRTEGHVPARRVLPAAAAKRRQPFTGLRIDAVQRSVKLGLRDRPGEAEPLGRFAGPATGWLAVAAVVVVALQMAVIARG